MLKPVVAALGVTLALAACQENRMSGRSLAPIPPATLALMSSKGMTKSDPIIIRSYKKESEMEVWKRGSDGRYTLLKTYPICRWSGQLGPKVREGDRQAPEGFYAVTPAHMNPNSSYYLSFDTGFPNAYDRSKGRSGSNLMVHGSCSSRGCFAMTDQSIAEIYAIAREAFAGGQRNFQFQSYPFRMTPKNMALHRADPNIGFWKNLKEGSDYFEVKHEEPRVAVCAGRYTFNGSGSCSGGFDTEVAQKSAADEREVASLITEGTKAVRLVYDDGSQHTSFQGAFASDTGSNVSRPESLASGPHEILVDETVTTTASVSKVPAVAASKSAAVTAPLMMTPAKAAPEEPVDVAQSSSASGSEKPPIYKRMFTSLFGG